VAGEGPLRTERLVLVALVPPLARAAVEDREEFERSLGARVPEPWPMADFARMLPQIATGHEEGSAAGPTRLVVAEGTLVGETGFHGPPDQSGTVEVGYGVLPSWRGQGIATEATRALISHAFDRSPRRGLLRRGGRGARRSPVPAGEPGLAQGARKGRDEPRGALRRGAAVRGPARLVESLKPTG